MRGWIKVKHRSTADCVVGGYRLAKGGDGIGALLLGLYDDEGSLHYVGHTSSFKAAERRALLTELQPLVGGDSFGGMRAPGGQSRWSAGKDTEWVSLEPRLVAEVTFDRMQDGRMRHAATFVRWRPDRDARSCTWGQLGLEPPSWSWDESSQEIALPGVVVDLELLLRRSLVLGHVPQVQPDPRPCAAAPAHRVDEHVGRLEVSCRRRVLRLPSLEALERLGLRRRAGDLDERHARATS